MKNNFIQRAITGIIFVGVLIGCILGGPISFTLLFALITALTIHEFGNIVSKQPDVEINKPICMLAGVFLFFGFAYLSVMPGQTEILIPYLFLIIYLLVSELYLKKKNPLNNWAYAMMSQIYIALSFAMLNVLAYHSIGNEGELSNYQVQYNPILPLSIFIFTWINDTGAYCTGMLFGKHRLFERISPKNHRKDVHWRRSFQYYSCHCDGTLLPIHANQYLDRISPDRCNIRYIRRFDRIAA